MLNEQDGDAEAVPDGVDALQQLRRLGGVHTGGRLIQKQQLHVGGQCPCDLQLSLLTIGQTGGQHLGLVLQMADSQQLHGLFRNGLLRLPELSGAEGGVEKVVFDVLGKGGSDVVDHAHLLEQADVLEGTGHARRHKLMGLLSVERYAVEQYRALGGRIHAGEQVEHRGLARAVGADQAQQLALIDPDVEIVDGFQAAEADAQLFCLQYRDSLFFSHGSLPPFALPSPRSFWQGKLSCPAAGSSAKIHRYRKCPWA